MATTKLVGLHKIITYYGAGDSDECLKAVDALSANFYSNWETMKPHVNKSVPLGLKDKYQIYLMFYDHSQDVGDARGLKTMEPIRWSLWHKPPKEAQIYFWHGNYAEWDYQNNKPQTFKGDYFADLLQFVTFNCAAPKQAMLPVVVTGPLKSYPIVTDVHMPVLQSNANRAAQAVAGLVTAGNFAAQHHGRKM